LKIYFLAYFYIKSMKKGTSQDKGYYGIEGGSKYLYDKSNSVSRKSAKSLAEAEGLLTTHFPELSGGCLINKLLGLQEGDSSAEEADQDPIRGGAKQSKPVKRGKMGKMRYYQLHGRSQYIYDPDEPDWAKLVKRLAQAEHLIAEHHGFKGGFVGRLVDKAKEQYAKFKRNPLGYPAGYEYCAPFTDLSVDRPPTNATDGVCRTHDYAYEKIQKDKKSGKINKEEAGKEVRKADNEMLDSLKKLPNKGIKDKVVELAIKAKTKAEDAGLINPNRFVGGRKRQKIIVL
jgi:hypothetical protein